MSNVSANITMPTVFDTLKPATKAALGKTASAKTNAASNADTSSSSSSTSDASGLGTTFLSLLASELENQDPTAPVDPTAMVGQMISLNQLEQLISINQSVTGSSTSSSSGTGASSQAVGATASTAALASSIGGASSTLSPSAAGAATSQLPFDPNTMMPLGFGNTGATAASVNSILNPATVGFSGANSTSGGK